MPLDAYTDATDDALMVLFANGDRLAAQELTSRLAPRVLAQAYRVLGDRAEAEDVTQEAMLRLWRQAADWRQGEAKVSTWLYQVAGNLCTDRLRKRWPQAPEDAAAELADTALGAEARMQQGARARALHGALQELPDRQRQAVVLRHLEELPNPEIAHIMGVGVEAVESLISRGKRQLVGLLGKRKQDLGVLDD